MILHFEARETWLLHKVLSASLVLSLSLSSPCKRSNSHYSDSDIHAIRTQNNALQTQNSIYYICIDFNEKIFILTILKRPFKHATNLITRLVTYKLCV